MKGLKLAAWWLVVLGALNWLLIGLGGFLGNMSWNVVSMVFGSMVALENLVYVLVGFSGLWLLWDKLGGSKK